MSFTLETSQQFIANLEQENAVIDVCDLNNNSSVVQLINTDYIEKLSASASTVQYSTMIANLIKGRFELPVTIKLFFDYKTRSIGSLFYEYVMYKLLTEEVINKKMCPNFVPLIAFGCCKEFEETPLSCFLITEKVGNGMNFQRPYVYPFQTIGWCYRNMNLREKQEVLFQIVYSLAILELFQINHNDLHDENVLVTIMDKPVVLKYVCGKQTFTIKTRFIPYLFDWDNSYVDVLGPNPIGNDTYNPHSDAYTLFCFLDKKIEDESKIVTSYSRHPATTLNKSVSITKQQYNLIKTNFKPDRIFYDQPIYKLSEAEYRSFIGIPPARIKDVYFYLNETDISFWKPNKCLLTSTSKDFETPLQMLVEHRFKMFENDSSNTDFVYRLPSREYVVNIKQQFASRAEELIKKLSTYLTN